MNCFCAPQLNESNIKIALAVYFLSLLRKNKQKDSLSQINDIQNKR